MSNRTPFNLTIVLPPNRQYYVSYFYLNECYGNSLNTCKYRSNVTTALEEGWHTADVYNEFWKDNPTRGEPIRGNIYKVPFTFDYGTQFLYKACTYFVFSYYENEELYSFVYAINENGAHTGGTYVQDEIRQYLKTDTDGSLLVYVGFVTDYATQIFAPGRKIYNHTLGLNDVLVRSAAVDKCNNIGIIGYRGDLNNFPEEMLVNGYYIFTSSSGVIDGEYQLVDGYNAGTKVPEFTNAILKPGFTLNWVPTSTHYHENPNDTLNCAFIFRFKFTETNGENRIYRVMHYHVTGRIDGGLDSDGDIWIDPDTKELKIWSWVINPAIRVLKQLPDNALSEWHELFIPYTGYLSCFYFDGEYFDLVEICGRNLPSSFQGDVIPGFSDITGGLDRVAQDAAKVLDYAAVHVYSESKPYVMKDNYFDYYEPILPDVPEPEPEEEKDLTKYLKNNYYVSNRQEAGTLEYSIDPTKITDIVYVPFITIQEVKNFIRHNELIEGSFFGDINRTDLKFPREMGNLEWVIHALQLNPRIKYTPDSLAAFLHQYDEENTYTTPKVGVYLIVDEDLSTIFDELTQIFNPTFKHVGLLLLEDTSTI